MLQLLLYYKLVDMNRLRIDNKIDMEIYIGINSKKMQLFIRITYIADGTRSRASAACQGSAISARTAVSVRC